MTTSRSTSKRGAHRRRLLGALGATFIALVASGISAASSTKPPAVRAWEIQYTAHNGVERQAVMLLPAWYGPQNNPALPLVISPHGRNGTGRGNAKYWGQLPAIGRFAVINPDGMGRRLPLKSYAYKGQIDDLARMPELARVALPWLRIDTERIYALGSSMGGHETLMLVARYPELLAGAVAMDSVTNLSRRYYQLPDVPCDRACLKRWGKPYGLVLQAAMRAEVGGTPEDATQAYTGRSPLENADKIAFSGVRLQIWWSNADRIVTDQKHQSRAFFRELKRLNPCAPISAYAGGWEHSKEMKADALLPIALADLGLLRKGVKRLPQSVHHQAAPRGCEGSP